MNGHRIATQPMMDTVLAVNIAAIVAAAGLLVYYVVIANGLAAQTWQYADAQKTMRTLTEARTSLVAQQAAFEDREGLTQLATGAGFVPAGTVDHVIQPPPVAAR